MRIGRVINAGNLKKTFFLLCEDDRGLIPIQLPLLAPPVPIGRLGRRHDSFRRSTTAVSQCPGTVMEDGHCSLRRRIFCWDNGVFLLKIERVQIMYTISIIAINAAAPNGGSVTISKIKKTVQNYHVMQRPGCRKPSQNQIILTIFMVRVRTHVHTCISGSVFFKFHRISGMWTCYIHDEGPP
jgi:hypothetical protein